MYHINNMIKWLAENRQTVGDEAPGILLRAFHTVERGHHGMFVSGAVLPIMRGNQNWEQMFMSAAQSVEHMSLAVAGMVGAPAFDALTVLFVLFGDQTPCELIPFLRGENKDVAAFNRLVREKLRERGVDWDINIELVTA